MGMNDQGTERDVGVLRFSCFFSSPVEKSWILGLLTLRYLMHTSTGASGLGLTKKDSLPPGSLLGEYGDQIYSPCTPVTEIKPSHSLKGSFVWKTLCAEYCNSSQSEV
jgi:hypothetical protein